MKLYHFDFNSSFTYKELQKHKVLESLDIHWERKSNHPEYVHVSNPTEAHTDHMEELQANWQIFPMDYIIEHFPQGLEMPWSGRKHLLTHEQFECVYKFGTLDQIITTPETQQIDLDKLSDLIVNKLKPLLKD
jgi:hypothetical protein